jgi:hypothetical protein
MLVLNCFATPPWSLYLQHQRKTCGLTHQQHPNHLQVLQSQSELPPRQKNATAIRIASLRLNQTTTEDNPASASSAIIETPQHHNTTGPTTTHSCRWAQSPSNPNNHHHSRNHLVPSPIYDHAIMFRKVGEPIKTMNARSTGPNPSAPPPRQNQPAH